MPLPPITFQRPERRPGLVEQAIVGTLAALASEELIGKPRERRDEARARRATEQSQRFATTQQKRGFQHDVQMQERVIDAQRSNMVFQGELAGAAAEREFERQESTFPELEVMDPILSVLARRAGVDLDPDTPGVQYEAPEGATRQSMFRTASVLENAWARGQQERALGQGERDWFLGLLAQTDAQLRDLPPTLVRGDDGELRLPTDEEQSLRRLHHGGVIGALAHPEDPRVQNLNSRFAQLEERLVEVPAYDPQLELQYMGGLSGLTPRSSAEALGMMRGVTGWLERAGLVGGRGNRGLPRWFKDDHGNTVQVGSDAEFLNRFPNEAQSRLRGALWAQLFFREPEALDRAKQQYQLHDDVAEQTWRAIVAGESVTAPPRGVDGRSDTSRRQTLGGDGGGQASAAPTRPPAVESTTARQFLEGADQRTQEDFLAYVNDFADPVMGAARRQQAMQEVADMFSMDDAAYVAEARRRGLHLAPAPSTARGEFRGAREMTDAELLAFRDRQRLDAEQVLQAAWVEAAYRRRQARTDAAASR